MILRWHNIPEQPDGSCEVELSRRAIAEAISRVWPRVDVRADLLTFVPLGDGRTQVNVHGVGPFGVLEPVNC